LAKVGKVIQPYGEHTVRISLIAVFALVALLEVNQIWDGVISSMWRWVWETLFGYKTVTFGLGMLTCYLLMRHRRVRQTGHAVQTVFKTAPIRLDLEALEENAKKMGVELHLQDDPRISKRNAGFPMVEPGSEDKK
jgi:hypothetical protein